MGTAGTALRGGSRARDPDDTAPKGEKLSRVMSSESIRVYALIRALDQGGYLGAMGVSGGVGPHSPAPGNGAGGRVDHRTPQRLRRSTMRPATIHARITDAIGGVGLIGDSHS